MFDDPVLPGGTSEPPQRARWGRRVVLLVLGLGGLAFLQSTDIIYGRSSRGSDRIERRGDRARIPGSRPIYNTPHPGAKSSPPGITLTRICRPS